MTRFRIVPLLLGVGLLAGCAQPVRYPINAFYQYDYDDAVKGYRATVVQARQKDMRNVVLADVHLAAASFAAGDYYDTLESLHRAQKIMEDVEYGKDEGQVAMVASHTLRVFKGEPYERALAFTYMGLIYYRRGDWENARAAFNLALLADRGSKGDNEEYRDDFGLAHYMIGRTYLKLNEADNARISFDKVAKYEKNPALAAPERLKGTNATFIIELGCGPYKLPDPVVGSVDTIHQCRYPDRSAEILLDGQSLGRSARLVDMNYQAKTSGTSTRDTVQAVKGAAVAVMKQIPFVGILGSVAEMAGVNKADLRHWRLMPGEVHVLEAQVPEGLHTVQIVFRDEHGKPLERYAQIFHAVRLTAGEQLYVLRSGLDRHNEVRPKAASYLTWGHGAPLVHQQRGFESAIGADLGVPIGKAP
ncbi:MAG: hypothetical protein HY294_08235 [Candidatus Rokubacteria bacterium]|nr:hypothetical protein [Candidatus Rokubacteria bacterium]